MKNQTFQWDTMTMGVCYYPEHWPKELWADDIDRMIQAAQWAAAQGKEDAHGIQ